MLSGCPKISRNRAHIQLNTFDLEEFLSGAVCAFLVRFKMILAFLAKCAIIIIKNLKVNEKFQWEISFFVI